jgi:hypothetical protein
MKTSLTAFVRCSAHTLAVTYLETYVVFAVLRTLAPASVHTMVLVAAVTATLLSFAYARVSAFVRGVYAKHRTRGQIVVHVHLSSTILPVRPLQRNPASTK